MSNTPGQRLIYHGSREIVEFPEIRTARYHKDFYFGFYCTSLREQAERWAVRYGRGGIVVEVQKADASDQFSHSAGAGCTEICERI